MTMINHVRTLLLDAPGAVSFSPAFPGEEFVPADFIVVNIPLQLFRLRTYLFGFHPDRAMMNYRLRQFMALLHSCELADYVTALDPRITYWPIRDDGLFDQDNFTVTAIQTAGAPALLYMQGAPDMVALSRLLFKWQVTVVDSSNVLVTQLTEPLGNQNYTYTVTDGLSSPVPLTSSPLSFKFSAPPGTQWIIQVLARPAVSLSEILAAVDNNMTDDTEKVLFGDVLFEPFLTFSNLWHSKLSLPYRLGGVLLALAYMTEHLRTGASNG